jgi:hypothetical protein
MLIRNYNATWEGNTSNDRVLLFNLESDPSEQVQQLNLTHS